MKNYNKSSGTRFAISSGCRYATKAAADTLSEGGNIFDAAIVGSAVLCVTLPHAVSIGGDLFALIKEQGNPTVTALNATGAAPSRADISLYRDRGFKSIPMRGPLSLQTPGLVAGWDTMVRCWATLPMTRLLEPAVTLARDGFQIGARMARLSKELAPTYSEYRGWLETYFSGGTPIPEGGVLKQERLANTLMLIAREGPQSFYSGRIAEDIVRSVAAAGGLLGLEDLAAVTSQVTPALTTKVGGVSVSTQPPVSQGAVLLRALRIFEESIRDDKRDLEMLWPVAAAALRIAFAERMHLLGDQANAFELAEAMVEGQGTTAGPKADLASAGTETTNISIIDSNGNAVSLILSIFADFGSGIVADETGILLNNRLSGFFLDEKHPNGLKPGKRTIHTLHSVIVTNEEDALLAGGSPGGHAQPQVNLQVLSRLLLRNENLENAVAAPRWMLTAEGGPYAMLDQSMRDIWCEPELHVSTRTQFETSGFRVTVMDRSDIGSAKWVQRCGPNDLAAACDRRRDATTAAG